MQGERVQFMTQKSFYYDHSRVAQGVEEISYKHDQSFVPVENNAPSPKDVNGKKKIQ